MIQRVAVLGAAALVSLGTLACGERDSVSPAGAPAGESPDLEVVAELEGTPITTAELDAWIKEQLFRSRASSPADLYELREQMLRQLIDERVLESEASRRGIDPEELIQLEVQALGPVSDQEVADFYEQRRERMGGATLEQVQDRIRQVLGFQRSSEVRKKLREQADVTIYLEPPRLEIGAHGPSKGPADARVTIVEFSDFQCPFCRRVVDTLEQILERYPEDVRLVFRQLPLTSHRRSRPAAEAALCAQDQQGFWPYHDKLFENPRALEDQDLLRYAEELGLDTQRFEQCFSERQFAQQVDADLEEARSAGISGTPAFTINGVLLSGARPLEEFTRVIDAELSRLAAPQGS